MDQVLAPILTNTKIPPDMRLLWVQAPEIATVARPGQFVMVRCGNGTDPLLRRPLSIHWIEEDQLALLFEPKGKGTHLLADRIKGEKVDIMGPLGNGFSIDWSAKKLLLISGGLGIAPLPFLAEKAMEEGKSVTLLAGFATRSQFRFDDVFPPGTKVIVVTEDGTQGEKGVVTDFVGEHVDLADSTTQVFACGPLSMYRTMATKPEFAQRKVQISLEVRMGCGVGACYGCTVETKKGPRRVCQDGPVFDLHDILWKKMACI